MLYNSFDNLDENPAKIMESKGSLVISDCTFEIKDSLHSGIYYVKGHEGVHLEMSKCSFTGDLTKGSHYIDGENRDNNTPKLIVRKCKFSNTMERALNLNKYNEYLSIDLKEHTFEFDGSTESKKSISPLLIGTAVVVPAAVVALLVGFVIFIIKRKNPNTFDENEMTAEARDILLNESLIDN